MTSGAEEEVAFTPQPTIPDDADDPPTRLRSGDERSGDAAIRSEGGPPSTPLLIGSPCPACAAPNHEGVASCRACGHEIVPRTSEARARTEPAASTWRDDTLMAAGVPQRPVRFASQRPPSISRAVFSADFPPLSPGFDDLEAPLADPLIGLVVAERYRILEPLGRGGMGIVYTVEHTRIGKLLAMKLLTGELSQNREVVRRFKQEALTSSKLSSPNTVQVFDFGASDRLTYLVMELVTGEDLGRTLRASGPMPFARLGRIVIQMCNSLAEAHQKGIVHRDIKPENVMLVRAKDETDLVKVLDFGLAKLREGAELMDVTSQGAIVGTPYYMSPEQVRGDPVDARSDIYSLGALMYRALTGHYPFTGQTPMAVFTKHLTEPPPPLHERAPELDIPPRVGAIVLKALAKGPIDRFQRAEDLQAALVEEIRALGTSSVDSLLDSRALRRLAHGAAAGRDAHAPAGAPPGAAEVATRDEVEAYERKLRRQRYGAVGFFGLSVASAAAFGVHALLTPSAPVFTGAEVEPNDSAGDATPVPFGRTVSAFLGKRIDAAHGDRDFYAFDVPASSGGAALVRLGVSAVPNFATCTLLYRQGLTTPVAQYCAGRAGRDLVIDALRLEPGRYLAAVMQDLDPYAAAAPPFIFENVSDPYVLSMTPAAADPGAEVEPNDQVASANAIAVAGASMRGVIGWAHDEDVFCATGAGSIRWQVRDVVRAAGTALEVTPTRAGEEGAPVRVHAAPNGTPSATDALSPWVSEALDTGPEAPRCLRVRLTIDPWTMGSRVVVPSSGSEEYVVDLEAQ